MAGKPSGAKIDRARSAVESAQIDYLRARGWTTTSNTPGSYWVWTKEHDGRSLMADTSLAVSFQRAIDGFDCLCDEDQGRNPNCPIHDETEE